MAEQEFHEDQLPLGTAGQRLRNAREAAGLSIGEVSDRTKIAKRYLLAIEEDRFADLAGRTYAVGFSRAYARTVGLGEAVIADAVRDQLAAEEEHWPGPKSDTFEPGDPARVPPAGLAWMAGLGALVVIVLLFVFWRSFIDPAGSLPDLTRDEPPRAVASEKAKDAGKAAPAAANGPVVFTALAPEVWVRFYDASGNRLFEAQMSEGESYTVPADADGPMIRTARPDALRISVGGRIVPGLGDAPVTVRDVPVTAAALLARGKEPAASETGAPALQPSPPPAIPGPVRRTGRTQPAGAPSPAGSPASPPDSGAAAEPPPAETSTDSD